MEFKPEQGARVAKLIQVGCDRAAATLSDCTGLRTSVDAPAVSIRSMAEAMTQVKRSLGGEVATVVQRFSGSLSGHAIFVLDESSALILSNAIQARGPVNIVNLSAGEYHFECVRWRLGQRVGGEDRFRGAHAAIADSAAARRPRRAFGR